VRERVERGDANHAAARDERETLDRRDADSQAGERSGTGRDREQIDRRQRNAVGAGHGEQFVRQPFGVRARIVAVSFLDHAIVFD
jgi:hypothetical protein